MIATIVEWDTNFKIVEIHILELSNKEKKMVVELIFGSAIVKFIQENGEVDYRMVQEYISAAEMKKNMKECFLMDLNMDSGVNLLQMEINMKVNIS